MKKLVIWILALLLCATTSVGATWAYLVNGEEEANVMTVGRVTVEQLEYERLDPESAGDDALIRKFHNNKPLYPGVHPNDFDFAATDSRIGWDLIGKAGYTSGIWDPEVVSNELDKMVFVRNLGNRDTYIRTIFAFETSPDWSFETFRELIHLNKNTTDWSWAWMQTPVTIGEGRYYVAVATYNHILVPDALSEISLCQVMMDKQTTGDDIAKLDGSYQILVYTQAVQADGFSDPETALNESFGQIDARQVPFEDDAPAAGVQMHDAVRYWEADGQTDISTLVTKVVFGSFQDYPDIPLKNDGTLVASEEKLETFAYYVQDDQEQYTVYFLSDGPIYAPADCTGLFEGMTALTTVVTDQLDVSHVESMTSMFKGCTALTEITGLEGWDTGAVVNMAEMFMESGLTGDLDLTGWDVSNVTDTSQMFRKCNNITSINAAGWDTSSVTNMRSMFYECLQAKTLNVTGWDTSNVTNTATMFIRCRAMTELIGSGDLNFGKVEQMNSMCEGWDSMTYIDVSNWNCGSAVNMNQIFAWALSMETIEGLNNWDVSNATSMSVMFYDCNTLTTLDLSGWDTSNVLEMRSMFRSCDNLTELNLSGWDTSNVTNSYLMFFDARALEKIYVSDSWNMDNVTNGSKTFGNNTKLVGGNGTKYSDSNIGVAYARLDLPAVLDDQGNVITEAVPGYLTHINDKP